MLQKTITIEAQKTKLSVALHRMQQNNELCDVYLECKDGVVAAHSLILLSTWTSFPCKEELQKCCNQKVPAHIPMKNVLQESLTQFVSFLYTGMCSP